MGAILAIDLGKFNSIFSWLNPVPGGVEFRTAKTTPTSSRACAGRPRISPSQAV